jgi:hypothetical protein
MGFDLGALATALPALTAMALASRSAVSAAAIVSGLDDPEHDAPVPHGTATVNVRPSFPDLPPVR